MTDDTIYNLSINGEDVCTIRCAGINGLQPTINRVWLRTIIRLALYRWRSGEPALASFSTAP